MNKKAFTLIEVLIAITLAAVLFSLIFRAYVSITHISTRLHEEKMLNAEIAFVTETVQNIADSYQIDYGRYGSALTATEGRTATLYLTGGVETGAALQFSGNNLYWIHGDSATALIASGSAFLSNGTFKVIPYTKTPLDPFLAIQNPGFWLIGSLQSAKYNPSEWVWNVEASVQQFYNVLRRE